MCVGSMENGQAINPLYVISHPLVHAAKQANDKTAIFFLIKKIVLKIYVILPSDSEIA